MRTAQLADTASAREARRQATALRPEVGPIASAIRLTLLLALIAFVFQGVFVQPLSGSWSGWRILERVARVVSLILPFAAFVVGTRVADLRLPPTERRRLMVVGSLLIAGASYVLGAVIEPVAEYRAVALAGSDVGMIYPFESETPDALVRHHAHLRANPSTTPSFSTNRPFDRPASWIAYLIAVPIIHALLALLYARIGYLAGSLTAWSAFVRRRLFRWALGLGGAVGYLVIFLWAGAWLRQHPDASGLLVACAPLLVPLAQVVGLDAMNRRSIPILGEDAPLGA